MSKPPAKRARSSENNPITSNDEDEVINALLEKVGALEKQVQEQGNEIASYYASNDTVLSNVKTMHVMPKFGMAASHVSEAIQQYHSCDFNPRLNTSSYVNVVSEPEEQQIALLGAQINLADGNVYPASIDIHNTVVNMLAKLWNAPRTPQDDGGGSNYCGTGTVGSTEACLLAGLALKFRWRQWFGKRIGNSPLSVSVIGVKPNLVISSCFQACWEKFFKYHDVEPKVLKPNLIYDKMAVNARALAELCDENTIGVVAILGNHYNGAYDPVWEIDEEIRRVNKERNLQVGIHIDAASGGFIAPFEQGMKGKEFDFRLQTVLSMSSSGHKFGESICGTGWIVFRRRKDLAEHISTSVTYLGGHTDSMALNFSRPASGVYVQFYKMLRLGREGYVTKVKNQMTVASFLRTYLRNAKNNDGELRFEILDSGDSCCLPVVSARLNPKLETGYNDIDLQHALSESHWYVCGYHLGFENPQNLGKEEDLCSDASKEETMFRIVVKSNLTMTLAQNLVDQFDLTLKILDDLKDGFHSMHAMRGAILDANEIISDSGRQMPLSEILSTVAAAAKWSRKRKSAGEAIRGFKRTHEKGASVKGSLRTNFAC